MSTPTAAEVPVTRAMLGKVRTELLARIDQAREEAKADYHRLDAKIDRVHAELKGEIGELRAEVGGLRAEMAEMRAEIHEIKADLAAVKASVARIEVLVEEQNARNQIVLDGISALLSRQNQVEQRVTAVEETVRRLAAG